MELSQTAFLFVLCAGYLIAILANGALKYWLNIRRGRVGERLLRRLRLTAYRHWRHRTDGPDRNGEIVSLIAQELEPIGGFAAQAFAKPIFQGDTFVTIIVFMFAQDLLWEPPQCHFCPFNSSSSLASSGVSISWPAEGSWKFAPWVVNSRDPAMMIEARTRSFEPSTTHSSGSKRSGSTFIA